MSSAERSVRHRKLQTDRAISQAYSRLAQDVSARATFGALLHCVRSRSVRLLDAPVVIGRHPGVDALVNLSRFARVHLRTIHSWPGSEASWRAALNSLAQHLLSVYRVPGFLAAAWHADDERYGDAKRRWFVAHAAGASFRSLGLPVPLTRKMEHIFLSSDDHFGIEYALRRAELLGLGASPALTEAVLATRPALDLDHGAFWRTVWLFLIANASAIDQAQIGPLIDFVHSVRHERTTIDTEHGTVIHEPPQPQFSMKGRSLRSMLRLIDEWHRGLGRESGGLSWTASGLRPMVVETPRADPSAPAARWELTELTSSAQLRAEGAALRHCVARYSHVCRQGASHIWSLRRRRDSVIRPVLTVEVDPGKRAIVQARGYRNRRASGRALEIVQVWARRQNLRLTI